MKTKKSMFANCVKWFGALSIFAAVYSCSENELSVGSYEDDLLVSLKSQSSIELSYGSISASAEQEPNTIENIDDEGSSYLETRWSGYGEAVTVDIDFESLVTIDYLELDFLKSDERQARFEYWSSDNGSDWTYVGSKTSSGTESGSEEFDLTNITAKYLRLVFKGNSSDAWETVNYWNSVFDITVFGTLTEGVEEVEVEEPTIDDTSLQLSYVSVVASAEQGENPIENIDDEGNDFLETRWSGYGEAVNVDFDFGQDIIVDYLNIAFLKSNERQARFEYWYSADGVNWIYKGTETSSGTAVSYEEIDLDNIDARYLRLVFKGNSSDQFNAINYWNSVLDIEIYGVPGDNEVIVEVPVENSGETVEDILGDFWKITLPVDENGDGSDFDVTKYSDRNNNAAEFYDLSNVVENATGNAANTGDYFYIEEGWAVFKAFCGGATTENSQYPRSELRGLDASGDDSYFDMNDHQELEVIVKVLEVPFQRPEVNMVQIHGPDDEPLRVEFNDGSTGSDQGLHLTVNESDDNHNNIMDYEIGQELKVWVKVENGHLWIELDNLSTGGHYETDYDVVDATGYWKVGCYLQGSITYCDVKSSTSFCKNGGESDEYWTTGAVAAKDLKMIRDGVVYK